MTSRRSYFSDDMTFLYGGDRKARQEDANNFYKFGRVYPKWVGNHRWDEIRSKEDSPYGYSPYLVAGSSTPYKGEDIESYYDDRMHGWYGDKWTAALKKAFGERSSYQYASLEQMTQAISEVFGEAVECLQIIEGCNVSNGFPYRVFVVRRLSFVHVWPKGIRRIQRPKFGALDRTFDEYPNMLTLPNGKKQEYRHEFGSEYFYFAYGPRSWYVGRIADFQSPDDAHALVLPAPDAG